MNLKLLHHEDFMDAERCLLQAKEANTKGDFVQRDAAIYLLMLSLKVEMPPMDRKIHAKLSIRSK